MNLCIKLLRRIDLLLGKVSFSNPVFVHHGLNIAENRIINMHENQDILDRHLKRNLFLLKNQDDAEAVLLYYAIGHILNFKLDDVNTVLKFRLCVFFV